MFQRVSALLSVIVNVMMFTFYAINIQDHRAVFYADPTE
jgi:hypothetical protein